MNNTRHHIAMIGVPAISHILPSIDIIRELVSQGHHVTYANDPSVRDIIEDTGATLVPYDSSLPVADNDWPEDPIGQMDTFLTNSINAYSQVRDFYTETPADLYMYDIGGYPGRVLAETQGRPSLQISPAVVGWKGYTEEMLAQLWELPGATEYRTKFEHWLTTSGATTTDAGEFPANPDRCVAVIPSAMQPHADLVDRDRVSFVGPCFSLDNDEQWTPPHDDKRLLVISLGSAFTRQPDFYRACISAFGDLPEWHVVLQIGKHLTADDFGTIPNNIEIHNWIPQRAMLTHADAFITHAGMGGSSEGLLSGTPMVAVPQAVDQFMNADRLVELGIARRIDTEEVTPETLRDAVTELTHDATVKERSVQLAHDTQREGGTRRAVEIIEALAEAKRR
ncbi:macrolide family glycosyltransferase [Haloglycomyces albus]|uniref:macrolide family glycosyltransferase n=1 Tax=Haloglycomyces albus TaxID=526067 RepID=UPI0004A244D4|nr:macrolide family glycosyltransferase [Haloglycomyces albus]